MYPFYFQNGYRPPVTSLKTPPPATWIPGLTWGDEVVSATLGTLYPVVYPFWVQALPRVLGTGLLPLHLNDPALAHTALCADLRAVPSAEVGDLA